MSNVDELLRLIKRWQSTGDPEEQIAALEAALRLEPQIRQLPLPLQASREQTRGALLSGLGDSYAKRRLGSCADNLEAALHAYEAALTVFTREAFPQQWAGTQNNLGLVYSYRIRGSKADNLEAAIKAHEAALTVRTREAFPQNWAQTQNNLGLAYWDRIRGSKADNLEAALHACEAALTVFTREAFPQDWATTQNSLAHAYRDRIRGSKADNLEAALHAYEAALTVFTREAFPQDWAMTHNNLAIAYQTRIRGAKADNLEAAIKGYEAALTVRTREAFPQNWAQTQNNLGLAYWDRIRGSKADNLEAAIKAHEAALTVFTREALPRDNLLTGRLLGKSLLDKRDWRAANAVYADARSAFLLLFGQGLEEAEAQSLIAEAGPLFAEAAYAAAETGDLPGAFSLLSEGKARLMAVALRQQSLDLPPSKRARLAALQAEIREWRPIAERTHGEEGAKALDQLIALRRELGDLLAAATAKDRAGSAVASAGALVAKGGAVVAPIITNVGGKLLFVASAEDGPVITALDLPELTTNRVSELMRGPAKDTELGGWLAAYNKNYEMAALRNAMDTHLRGSEEYNTLLSQYEKLLGQWLAAVGGLGRELWRLVGAHLSEMLQRRGVKPGARLIWLPTGPLGILPIGLAEDPATNNRLGDTFELVYAPSLEALAAASQQLAAAGTPTLAAINPASGLASTEIEVRIIASHFCEVKCTMLEKGAATSQAVLAALRDRSYWHFATHGLFDWADARRSALEMSGKELLTVGMLLEAEGLRRPRLVALSACETGLYDIDRNADEFIGLPGTFMALGAAGVLGSLWPVDDRATALLMSKFYDLHLREALSPPAALKRAQAWLREATRADLIAAAKAAAPKAGAGGEILAKKLEMSLMRGQHEDPRFASISKLLQQNHRSSPTDAPSLLNRLFRRKTKQKQDERPFAHPYYWGGFIYTGL